MKAVKAKCKIWKRNQTIVYWYVMKTKITYKIKKLGYNKGLLYKQKTIDCKADTTWKTCRDTNWGQEPIKEDRNLAKNQVSAMSAVFHSRVIRSSASPKFIELCMEMRRLCPSEGHKHGGRNVTFENIWVLQNSAARLLTATSRYEQVTPVLRSLHWLPVSTRIDF